MHKYQRYLQGQFFCLVFATATTSAQTNLGGNWLADYTEDRADRIPGPALGDYGGLPLNAAMQAVAETGAEIVSVGGQPVALGEGANVFIRDPDGFIIELIQR
jgi:catechol 2,3-dioxygenase-like lactoylglutathione lyase family enzyme